MLKDMPQRIARLPVDRRGYPVPKFATWRNGVPDFRLASTQWVSHALAARRCFICGETLGRYMAFVIGPMCAINRVTSEPPCHKDCAEFAVKNCPFLAFPNRGRDSSDLPDDLVHPGGIMIARNPGVSLVWVTDRFTVKRSTVGNAGRLIHLGEATSKSWWCRGRPATLPEVMASIESGLPHLRKIAHDYDGPEGERELEDLIAATVQAIQEDPRWHASES